MSQYNVQFQDGNGSLAGLRNQIINGDLEIWQRTSTPATGIVVPANNTTFTADRWSLTSSASFTSKQGVTTWEGASVRDMSLTGMSARTWIGTTVELNVPASVGQFGTGSKWMLSLISDSATAPEQMLIAFSNKSGSGRTDGNQLSYTPWALVETSGTTYRYATEITIDQPAVASSICLYFQFRFADSKTSLSFANVQLEPGPVVTPFEERPIGLELMLCQRYFQNASARGLITSVTGTAGVASAWIPGITMRTTPSTNVLTIRFIRWWGGSTSNPSISSVSLGQGGVTLSFAALTTTGVQDFRIVSGFDGNTAKDLELDAEL